MSKERLEEIKRKFDLDRIRRFVDTKLISPQDLIYLIQQAERVQELESRIADDEHFVAEILEQNKRYREAVDQIKNNIPLEFNLGSEYEAKKNVIRLMNIDNLVNEYLEGEE